MVAEVAAAMAESEALSGMGKGVRVIGGDMGVEEGRRGRRGNRWKR